MSRIYMGAGGPPRGCRGGLTNLLKSMHLPPPMDDKIFEALAHPLRRRALKLLGDRPRMYSELMEELGVDSPTLAFHLKKLAGLVEKNDRGFYALTELGRRALSVMSALEGAGQPRPGAGAGELVFSDRAVLKIDRALLEMARREGRKIRVFDTAILEVEGDVTPELLEVLEEVRDVAVVKAPRHLRPYVEAKARDVVMVTDRGILVSTLKFAVQLLGYLGPLKAFRRGEGLSEVYSGSFAHGGRVEVEVDGGRVRISRGPNRAVARCRDADDFEISPGAVSASGCDVELSLDGVESLALDVAGGYVALSLGLSELRAEVSGGVVDADLSLGRGAVSIEATGGAFAGRLRYSPFEGTSRLDVSATGGAVNLSLELPPDVGLSARASAAGGIVKTPKPRPGGRGVLEISAEAAGGAVKIEARDA